MEITILTVGMVQTNCYLVKKEGSRECIVIDPGDEAGKIYDYIQKKGWKCSGILLTHGHFDHIMGVAELAARTGAKTYAYEEEKELMMDAGLNGGSMIGVQVAVEPENLLYDRQVIEMAGLTFQVLHTPGHTRGGCCFYSEKEKSLFAGDTIFMESIGRTDLPTGNGRQLLDTIREKVLTLPEDVRIYPGHGPETTVGYEKQNNPYV